MELTVNQIILLLEIYRRTEETAQWLGTRAIDIRYLTKVGLIRSKAHSLVNMYIQGQTHTFILTEEGEEMVAAIKLATKESVL